MRKIDVLLIFVLLLEIALAIGVPIFIAKDESDISLDFNGNNDVCKYTIQNDNSILASSKRSAYVDTLFTHIDSTRTGVNSGEELQFYDINTLYLIPIGEGKCYNSKHSDSPIGEEWEFAYVGVTYTGKNFNYFAVALDDAGCGIDFYSDDDLYRISADNLVLSKTDLSVDLTEFYKDTETERHEEKKNIKYISDDYLDYFNSWNEPYHLFSENESISYIAEKADRKSVEIISACRSRAEYY